MTTSPSRTRWAALGAAVAVALGGGITFVAQASGTASSYTPIAPCRLMDTRPAPNNVGPRTTPIGEGESHVVAVRGAHGRCDIPAGATGIATNTTVLGGTRASFLTVYPADAARPQASNLNWVAGQSATPNQVTVGLSADGRIRVYNDRGNVNVIIDVVGFYTAASAGPPGPPGVPGWGTIPSGVTVTGPARFDLEASTGGGDIYWTFAFQAKAPGEPSVVFAPDTTPATPTSDPTCTGSFLQPTAPPGKVCVYVNSAFNLTQVQGFMTPGHLNQGFDVGGTIVEAGDVYLWATWAYTAP